MLLLYPALQMCPIVILPWFIHLIFYPLLCMYIPSHIPDLLGPTQPPLQWVPGVLSPRMKRPGREADTHLQLVPRSRIRGSIHPLPHTFSLRGSFNLIIFSLLPLFLKNRRLIKSPCCRSVYPSSCLWLCIRLYISPPPFLGLWGLRNHLTACRCIPSPVLVRRFTKSPYRLSVYPLPSSC
jgi:hypothetical protein